MPRQEETLLYPLLVEEAPPLSPDELYIPKSHLLPLETMENISFLSPCCFLHVAFCEGREKKQHFGLLPKQQHIFNQVFTNYHESWLVGGWDNWTPAHPEERGLFLATCSKFHDVFISFIKRNLEEVLPAKVDIFRLNNPVAPKLV